jgi:hypothetical protein
VVAEMITKYDAPGYVPLAAQVLVEKEKVAQLVKKQQSFKLLEKLQVEEQRKKKHDNDKMGGKKETKENTLFCTEREREGSECL